MAIKRINIQGLRNYSGVNLEDIIADLKKEYLYFTEMSKHRIKAENCVV